MKKNLDLRTQLIEILSSDPCDQIPNSDGCQGCPYELLITDNSTCFETRYADHLIANGVTLKYKKNSNNKQSRIHKVLFISACIALSLTFVFLFIALMCCIDLMSFLITFILGLK